MQVVSAQLVSGKKVLIRLDIDVPIGVSEHQSVSGSEKGKLVVLDDFRLKAGLGTLKLCLENASEVIVMGHLGRPKGEDKKLSVAPIYTWLENQGFAGDLESGKLQLLENLRFEEGEDSCDLNYAKELAALGEIYINEAFAAHHPAASTTVLPTLLPHAAGLRFAEEVKTLSEIQDNPQRPLIAVVGGAKIEDKLPAVRVLSKIADVVLVGGKISQELEKDPGILKELGEGVVLGELNKDKTDLTPETIQVWKEIILHHSKSVIWNGPLGKIEDPQNNQSKYLAEAIIESGAKSVVGGGDTVSALDKWNLLDKFNFVSTGGGAMLEFLTEGTLPAIEALS